MADEKKLILTDQVYDVLNRIVKLGFPALGTLYFGLAKIWGFPYGEEVVGTLALLATFGGVLLAISKSRYDKSDEKFDGELVVSNALDPELPTNYNFNVGDIDALNDKAHVLLKVTNTDKV